ncbi:MAG: MBL fold metallo-hydrolase [Chitinophagaceae bacterium]
MTSSATIIFLFLLFCLPAGPDKNNTQSNKAVGITYTGNMGVLISNEKTAVWIDGLHEYYRPEYLNPPDYLLEKAYTKMAPFNNLQWLLFTHYHRDHFSKKLAKDLIQQTAHYKVIGAPQIVDSFSVSDVVNAWNKNAEVLYDDASSLRIKAFNIPHIWPQRHAKVQNIAYLVELNGVRILHAGDADTDIDAFNRAGIGSIDAAIVPEWFINDEKGKQIIEKLGAKSVIVTHISPGEKHDNNSAIKNAGIVFFETIGQFTSL